MNKLEGKRVLVTGAATGIGRAVVIELARCKSQIGIHYFHSHQQADELKEQLIEDGIKVETFQADLTDSVQAQKLVDNFVAWAGGLDILINNAGDIIGRKKLEEMDSDFFRKVIAVNVDSTVMVTKAAIPHLKASVKENAGASIVNMASLAGRNGGGTGSSAYCASKGAIITWTKAMARELGPDGIRVNAVAPGLILGTKFHATHTPKEVQQQIIASIPLKRAGRPEDVARAMVYLASEYDGFINGATLDIHGGVW